MARLSTLAASLVVSGMLAAGCGPSEPSQPTGEAGSAAAPGVPVTKVADMPPANGPGTFTFINRGDIITLDLNQMSYLQDFRISYGLREGLFTYDTKTLEPIKRLAKDYTLSEDKRTWTFTLRDDAKWSNGDPVTAADFVFSWRNLLESPGEYSYLVHYIAGAKDYQMQYQERGSAVSFDTVGMKALSPTQLEVKLTNPVPFFPDLLAFPTFYPRHEASMKPFKKVDDKGRVSHDPAYTLPGNVVTNGPFSLATWEPGKQLVLEANPNYWDKPSVQSQKIIMVVNSDPQSAFQQYESGRIDWMADVNPDISAKLKQINRSDLRTAPAYGTAFLTFNCATEIPSELGEGVKNPLADVRVRKALAMTIEKDYITRVITRMGEQVANSYVPPGFFEGYVSTPTPSFNVEAARRLLAEAGYPDGKGFPTLTYSYNSENSTRKLMGEFMVQSWRDSLNIKVDLRPMELKMYRAKVTEKNYTIAAVAWYGDYMDLSTWTDKYLSTSENNDSNWGPPEYDALCAAAAKEPDEAKRQELLRQAEEMINTQLPIVPLYHFVNVTLNRDNVKGVEPNAKTIVMPINFAVK